MLFLLKKIASALILPPVGPLLLAALGLAIQKRRPRAGKALAWTGVVTLLVLCTPYAAWLLERLASDDVLVDLAQARRAQAIVILGGGVRRAPEFGGETVSRLALERVRYGARLAKELGLPVLVSGGSVFGGTAEALLMKDALERDFGVPVRWTESASRDTRENALHSADILKRVGVRRVVLVTHAYHMRRSVAEFAAVGLEPAPAPTDVIAPFGGASPADFLPSARSLYDSYLASHELLGQLAQRLR